jgi:hypothetical protein
MRKCVLVATIFVFFTVLFTFPAVLHLQDKIIGDGGDSSQELGWQYVAETQTQKGVYPFSWTNYWRYPVGIDFSISYDSIIFILLGLFYYIFTPDPVLVFNLSVLSLVFLNGIFSYIYFKKISKSSILGILGATIYGFSFYTLARLGGHMNLVFIGCFPFFAYSVINLIQKRGNVASFAVFTSAIILTYLASLEYALILVGGIILLIPPIFIFYREKFISFFKFFWNNKIRTIISLIISLVPFVLINFGHIASFFKGNLYTLPIWYSASISPYLRDFLQPGNYTKLLINHLNYLHGIGDGDIEQALFLGYAEFAIFFLFLVSGVSKKFRIFVLISTAIILTTSLGCRNPYYPFGYLYSYFPFKGVAEAGRFYVILYLLFTTGIVYYLSKIRNRFKILITLIIFALVILERFPSGFYLSDTPQKEMFIQAVKTINSKAVLDLPIVKTGDEVNLKRTYDLYSVFYKKPIVNGYVHWLGNTEQSNLFINKFDYLTCGTTSYMEGKLSGNNLGSELVSNEITIIVLHKHVEVDAVEDCEIAYKNIYVFLNESNLYFKTIYEDDNTAVLQLKGDNN